MSMSQKELTQIRQKLEANPAFEDVSELLTLAGEANRLKLLYLLESRELRVGDLAEILGVRISTVSQHLTRLKAYRLVSSRRQAQSLFYKLSDHPFNAKLREIYFDQFRARGGKR